MRGLPIALAIFAGFLLGAGARAVEVRRGRVPETAPVRGAEAPAVPPIEPAPAATRSDDPAEATPASAVAESDSLLAELAAALAVLPGPALSVGSLALEGIVVDAESEALAGIPLRVSPADDPEGTADTTESIQARDFAKYIADRVAEHRHFHTRAGEAITDARGEFRIEGLANVSYRIEAPIDEAVIVVSVEGYPRGWVDPGDRVEISLLALCRVPVEVRLADGTLADGATIHVNPDEEFVIESDEHAWTPAAAEIPVPAGWNDISATIEDDWIDRQTVYVHPARVAPVVLRESGESWPRIDVVVRLPEGETTEDLSCRWLALAPGEAPSAERLLRNSGDLVASLSPDLEDEPAVARRTIWAPPGRYAIGIGRTRDSIEAIAVATVAEGTTELAMELPPLDAAGTIAVRAFDPGGDPIAEFTTWLWVDTGVRKIQIGHSKTHRADGAAALFLTDPEEIPAGSGPLWVQVYAEGLGTRNAPIEGSEVAIRFEEPGSLAVEFEGADVELWDLGVELLDGRGFRWGFDDNSDGGRLFRVVQPGEYRIEVSDDAAGHAEPIPIRCGPGENRVVVPLPDTYELEVELPPELVSASLELHLVESHEPGWTCGALDGARRGSTVRFDRVLAGRYTLVARDAAGTHAMPVTIAADARIVFRGADRQAILLRAWGEPPAAVGGPRNGDLVIGFEGEEFASGAEIDHAIGLLELGERWSLIVERPGEGRIAVEYAGWSYGYRSGGGFEFLRVARE